jgi:hypothetical protein
MFRVKKRQFFAVFLNFNTDPGWNHITTKTKVFFTATLYTGQIRYNDPCAFSNTAWVIKVKLVFWRTCRFGELVNLTRKFVNLTCKFVNLTCKFVNLTCKFVNLTCKFVNLTCKLVNLTCKLDL